MSEADTQKAILDWLAVKQIYALRLNTGIGFQGGRPVRAHSGGAGVADILAFIDVLLDVNGRPRHASWPLWIEVKSFRGIQSPEQQSFEAKVRGEGHEYIVARDLDEVIFTVQRMQSI